MPKAAFAVKRSHPRYSFFAEAEAILRDGTSVLAQVLEMSSHGCYIDAIRPVSVGSELLLRISNGESTFELPGKVIYFHPGLGFGICGMGVAFGEMATDQRSKIEEWLRERAANQHTSSPS
jgi:Tfp pilus assembly protein PilZ